MSKAILIATLMAVVSAFSFSAKAQAPLKTKPSAKSDQPMYMITAHTVVHDDSTNSQLDNYVIVYGSEVLTVQYAESQISTVKPGAPLLEQQAPGKGLHLHFRGGVWPQEPDVSQVPQVGVQIRACEMDTKYPDSDRNPVIAIQSVSAPCMARTGDDTLHYVLAPNAGLEDLGYVNFDILEATRTAKLSDIVSNQGPAQQPSSTSGLPKLDMSTSVPLEAPVQPSAQSASPRMDIPAIAKSAIGAIVTVITATDDKPLAQGTGFLVSADGVIMTNFHVIKEGNVAIVKFPDGTVLPVDGVLATDKVRDLAIIKIHGKTFRTLALGNSDQVQVGEEVVAIGNPLGLELTVSNGIVSGLRTDESGKFLQTTAPISPGSSGGPLFNMLGEVVGINTMYLEGGENLNFAIPVNDAKRLLSTQSTKLQKLPNEEKTQEERSQGASVSEILTWIGLHFETLTLETTDYNQDHTTTPDTYKTDTSISFRGCQVTVKKYDHPSANGRYNLGDEILTNGPFNLGDFDPNGMELESLNQSPHGPNFFSLRLFSVQPFLSTIVDPGATIPWLRNPNTHNFQLLFTSKDMAERQQTAWHNAILGCGGKAVPEKLY